MKTGLDEREAHVEACERKAARKKERERDTRDERRACPLNRGTGKPSDNLVTRHYRVQRFKSFSSILVSPIGLKARYELAAATSFGARYMLDTKQLCKPNVL